jgi:hypothetical protein
MACEGSGDETAGRSKTNARSCEVAFAVMERITLLVLASGLSAMLMSSDCWAGPADSEVNQTVKPDSTPNKVRSGKAGEVAGRSDLDNTPAGGTLPGGTVPGGTLPGGTVPGGTLPNKTLPGGTVPGGTLPGGTLPGGTVPGGTVQSKKLPGE